jgi:hypothetical protein
MLRERTEIIDFFKAVCTSCMIQSIITIAAICGQLMLDLREDNYAEVDSLKDAKNVWRINGRL